MAKTKQKAAQTPTFHKHATEFFTRNSSLPEDSFVALCKAMRSALEDNAVPKVEDEKAAQALQAELRLGNISFIRAMCGKMGGAKKGNTNYRDKKAREAAEKEDGGKPNESKTMQGGQGKTKQKTKQNEANSNQNEAKSEAKPSNPRARKEESYSDYGYTDSCNTDLCVTKDACVREVCERAEKLRKAGKPHPKVTGLDFLKHKSKNTRRLKEEAKKLNIGGAVVDKFLSLLMEKNTAYGVKYKGLSLIDRCGRIIYNLVGCLIRFAKANLTYSREAYAAQLRAAC